MPSRRCQGSDMGYGATLRENASGGQKSLQNSSASGHRHRKGRRMAEQWFVVICKQAKEFAAACSIEAEGFRTFVPIQIVERSHAGKRERVSRPLFPRYIFVQFDRESPGFGKINYCQHVANKGLMCDGMDRPIAIRPGVMDRIMDSERTMMARVGQVTTGYQPGDKFMLQCGPYANFEATYVGEENGEVFVTVEMFGRPHMQTIAFQDVPASGKLIDKISA